MHAQGGGLIAGSAQELADLGWGVDGGDADVRFEVEALPLVSGRFTIAVSLADVGSGHVYHRRLSAAEFVVYSEADGPGGFVRLDGRWSLAGDVTAVSA